MKYKNSTGLRPGGEPMGGASELFESCRANEP